VQRKIVRLLPMFCCVLFWEAEQLPMVWEN
jgi:hypothetical protein